MSDDETFEVQCPCGRTLEVEGVEDEDHNHDHVNPETHPWRYELGKVGLLILASAGDVLRSASNHMVGILQIKQAELSATQDDEPESNQTQSRTPGAGMLHEDS